MSLCHVVTLLRGEGKGKVSVLVEVVGIVSVSDLFLQNLIVVPVVLLRKILERLGKWEDSILLPSTSFLWSFTGSFRKEVSKLGDGGNIVRTMREPCYIHKVFRVRKN